MIFRKSSIFIAACMLIGMSFSSCTKEDTTDEVQKRPINPSREMPDDSIHSRFKSGMETTGEETQTGDDKVGILVKEADDADARYQKTKSEADKKDCIVKQLTAANYLMFEANLSPKKKYPPALRRYRRVLEIDPQNVEAAENKKQIEEIYEQMGMPVPD